MASPESAVPDPLNALRWLQAHLEARLAAGGERLFLTPEARQALREIVRMKPGRMRTAPSPGAPQAAPSAPAAATAGPGTTGAGTGASSGSTTAAPPEAESPSPSAAAPALTAADKAARLAVVRAEAEKGGKARALGTLRDRMVFAVGNPDANLMLVGEAPGADEERTGEPFTGAAGRKLDQILQTMGLSRQDVYISNVCKFRPAMENQRTNNRKPTLLEMESCIGFVREEIAIVQPRVVVALGATAAEGLLGRAAPVSRLRGQWHEFAGIPLRVTYHPSWLLRHDSPEEARRARRLVWEDMLAVMDRLGMPVSEKQRRYFLT